MLELTRFEKENHIHFLEESRTMANEGNQEADTRVLLDTSMPGLGTKNSPYHRKMEEF